VPFYQGKIVKTLFQAQLEALGALPQPHYVRTSPAALAAL
jgi:hypothetical protein